MKSVLSSIAAALLSGIIVFAVLMYAGWHNLREERRMYSFEMASTEDSVRAIGGALDKRAWEQGSLPATIEELGSLPSERNEQGQYVDSWKRPWQYSVSGTSFTLFSLGADGKPGGRLENADLYHDNRNHAETVATFHEFYFLPGAKLRWTEIIPAGLLAGCLIIIQELMAAASRAKSKEQPSLTTLVLSSLAITAAAIIVGVVLLPLHIPNGH